MIIFELKLNSEKSIYNFQKKYKYEEIKKYFKLSQNEFNNILKIYNHLKEFKIMNKYDDSIKIKVNNKYEIILNKIKKDVLKNDTKKSEDNINLKNNAIKTKKEVNNDEFINSKNSVKSPYIMKEIFSFLDKKEKLNLIKYNKFYQKLLMINIDDYKKITGKYIKGKINGKVKEYNYDNKLIFEGEYLKGKRNGKGKMYNNNGKLIFEGKYLNGKRNGKGKEYDDKGKLKFQGEYLNDQKWNGIGYDLKGNIEYVLKNGKGEVKEYYYNGKLKFQGEYINGKKWKGKGYNINGNVEFVLKNGNGKI